MLIELNKCQFINFKWLGRSPYKKKENPLYLVLSYSTICSYYSETISENWLNGGCFQLFVIVDLELTGLFKHFMCYINEDLI